MDSAGKVTEYAGSMDGVEDVKYYKETVEKLTKVTNFLQIAALVIMAFLIVVSVVVVSNTIKLTVFARSREISIMKYVGATNWFIRGPFLVEGFSSVSLHRWFQQELHIFCTAKLYRLSAHKL